MEQFGIKLCASKWSHQVTFKTSRLIYRTQTWWIKIMASRNRLQSKVLKCELGRLWLQDVICDFDSKSTSAVGGIK